MLLNLRKYYWNIKYDNLKKLNRKIYLKKWNQS